MIRPGLRFEILKRDKFTCCYCGSKAADGELHVDHVKPRADGGSDDPSNLVTACSNCNEGKGARPLEAIPAAVALVSERELLIREHVRVCTRRWSDACRLIPPDPSTFARYLRQLSLAEVCSAIDTATSRQGLRDVAAYFCGICVRKVRQAEARRA